MAWYNTSGGAEKGILNISTYPQELKLELLSYAPQLRYASREWYCLHNVLYGLKCYQVHPHSWSEQETNDFKQFIQNLDEEIGGLREMCCSYILSSKFPGDVQRVKYLYDSWYWIYCAAFVHPFITLPSNNSQTEMKLLVPNRIRMQSVKVWLEMEEDIALPSFHIDVRVTFSDPDKFRSTVDEVIEPKGAQFFQWMKKKGCYCLYINRMELTSSFRGIPAVLVSFAVRLSGTASHMVIPKAIDLTPYQDKREWFLSGVSKDAYNCMVSRKLGGSQGANCRQYKGAGDLKRDFVFRYPNESESNPAMDWTAPYLLHR